MSHFSKHNFFADQLFTINKNLDGLYFAAQVIACAEELLHDFFSIIKESFLLLTLS
jgi:hypothetical protein